MRLHPGSWFALSLLVSCFVDRPVTRLAREGVELRKVEAFEASSSEQSSMVAAPGDFVFTGGGLRVVIGGLGREVAARGAVLEATYEGVQGVESVVLVAPRLYVAGVERVVRVARMYMLERASAPALRVEGIVHIGGRVIAVSREISLGRVRGTVSFSTRAFTLDPEGQRDVRMGARIAWGGPRPFVPGVGELVDETWHRTEWVGSQGASGSILYGDARGTLRARAVYEQHGANQLLSHTEIVQAHSFDLERGKPVYHKSVLVLSASALAQSVRHFGMWRAKPYREVWGYLPRRPQGSEVSLRDEQARILLHARPDERGRVVLPLVQADSTPAQGYEAVASAYGHAQSDPVAWSPDERPVLELVIPRGGLIRVRARERASGDSLPARVRLVSLEQAPPTSLGPDYRASGAGDTAIALAGDLGIDVPPGRYRVIVTHGPEWSMHETDVEVSETFSPRVTAALEHQVDPGAWVACDLHVHAAPSPDSEVTLDDRLATLAAEGIRFAVPTDHNHVTDYAPAAKQLSLDDLRTVSGVEVTTQEPNIGHFNAYPFPMDPNRPNNGAPDTAQLEAASLFRALHALDPELVVQVNHPRSEGGIGYFDVMHYDAETGDADPRFSAEFDALEVWNGFDLAQTSRLEQVFREFLAINARGQRVVATGSSDSHQVRYQLAGYPRTYAYVPPEAGLDPRAVVRAIKAGASFVTTGPFVEASIFGGHPGTTVQAQDGKATLAVRVQVPDWMGVDLLEVFVGKERVIERPLPAPTSARRKRSRPARLDVANIELTLTEDSFIVVQVSGSVPTDSFFGRAGIQPRAFTNPIFVDVDGDGRTRWSP